MYKLPLWDTANRTVFGEPGLFRGTQPVRLLYPAEKILKLYNPTLGTTYIRNVHFTHTPGSDLIYPVPGSGICGIKESEIFPDPASAAEQQEAVMGLYARLHRLQEPYKEVFLLRALGELSFRQIGELFGKTENWACVTYHRARKKLQKEETP